MSKVATKLNKNLNKDLKLKKNKKIKIKVKNKVVKNASVKNKAQTHKAPKKIQQKEMIIIDENQGLIFENEKTLFGYFSKPISDIESLYERLYEEKIDFSVEEQIQLESYLEITLDEPDEVWVDDETYEGIITHTLIRTVETKEQVFYYIAVVYLNTEDSYPTFVFFHFPTKNKVLLDAFREKEIVFHRKLEAIQFAAIEGDSLIEGDYLAIGLLESMLKLRSEKDIAQEKFQELVECRDSTINTPDEIWRKVDSEGHVLVVFIKEFTEMNIPDLHYIVVTEEDSESQVNSLLFSFPTNDSNLVDRYRQGENLEAEEVSTESSH